jgi:hypothetical protein
MVHAYNRRLRSNKEQTLVRITAQMSLAGKTPREKDSLARLDTA